MMEQSLATAMFSRLDISVCLSSETNGIGIHNASSGPSCKEIRGFQASDCVLKSDFKK